MSLSRSASARRDGEMDSGGIGWTSRAARMQRPALSAKLRAKWNGIFRFLRLSRADRPSSHTHISAR
jgi:hypothetical protein